MITYRSHFFVQGDEADKYLNLLAEYGAEMLIEEMDEQEMLAPKFLANGEPDILEWPSDKIGQISGDFVLSVGYDKQYLGIGKIVEGKF